MKKIKWTRNTHHGVRVECLGRALHVDITGGKKEWFAYALETLVNPDGLEAILDDHAHHSIGVFRSLARARKEAEKYLRRWLRERVRMMMPRPEVLSDAKPAFVEPQLGEPDDLHLN